MLNRQDLNELCIQHKLNIKWNAASYPGGEVPPEDYVEIENVKTWGVNEVDICREISSSVADILTEEERRGREFDLGVTGKRK
jgi:hypothetical protein